MSSKFCEECVSEVPTDHNGDPICQRCNPTALDDDSILDLDFDNDPITEYYDELNVSIPEEISSASSEGWDSEWN